MTAGTWVGLFGWATVAGLDLVSVLQGLLARPLVAAVGAGLLLGDPATGLRVGALLELFALDVVPVGASRYPDYGAAAVGAVVLASGHPWETVLGTSAALGLLLGWLGGATVPLLRRKNAQSLRAYTARLDAGEVRAVGTVQWTCLTHDLVRSAALAGGALAAAAALRALVPGLLLDSRGSVLTIVAVSGGVFASMHGAAASARRQPRAGWLLAGLVGGGLVLLR